MPQPMWRMRHIWMRYIGYATANVEDEARLDVTVQGFWGGHHQKTFFDV